MTTEPQAAPTFDALFESLRATQPASPYERMAGRMLRVADRLRHTSEVFADIATGLASTTRTRLAAEYPARAERVARVAVGCLAVAKAYEHFAQAAERAADAFMEAERAPYDEPPTSFAARSTPGACDCGACGVDPLGAAPPKPAKPS